MTPMPKLKRPPDKLLQKFDAADAGDDTLGCISPKASRS